MSGTDTDQSRRRWGSVPLSAALVVGADQASKAWARSALVDHGVALWPRHLYLELIHNRGATLGWLAEHPTLGTVLTLATMVALAVWWRVAGPRHRASGFALGLVLGGASSNLFDRLARPDAVVDLIVVIFAPGRRFPAFNLADVAVTVGLFALAVSLMRAQPAEPAGTG